MRPILALLLAAGIVVLVQAYMVFQRTAPRLPRPVRPPRSEAEGQFFLEATLTFDAKPGADFDIHPALEIELQGRPFLRRDQPVAEGETVRQRLELKTGKTDITVRAWPAEDQPIERAMRIRVTRDDAVLWEETVWSAPGLDVQAKIPLDLSHAAGPQVPRDTSQSGGQPDHSDWPAVSPEGAR